MAEGILRSLGLDVQSAGTHAHGLDPNAVKVMEEIDIDISGHTSKTFEQFLDTKFDYVITVCDDANENCPYFPGDVKRLHHDFRDPAKFHGSPEETNEVFRAVRDDIKAWGNDLVNNL